MALAFRITYERYSDLHDDTLQMAKGGLLVRVTDVVAVAGETPATLEIVLPDGARIESDVRVIQVLKGFGGARSRATRGGRDRPRQRRRACAP
jgi:hypothetical protein